MCGGLAGSPVVVVAPEQRPQGSLPLARDAKQAADRRTDEGDGVHRGDRVVQRGRVEHPADPDEAGRPGDLEGDLKDAVGSVGSGATRPHLDEHGVGEARNARALLDEALALYQALGDRHFTARTLCEIGYLALLDDDADRAGHMVRTSLATFRALGERWGIAESLEASAAVWAARSEPARAARIGAAAEKIRATIATKPHPFDALIVERFLALARAKVDPAAWAAAWGDGRTMSLHDAIALALGGGKPGVD